MEKSSFVLKGNICYNTSPTEVRTVAGGYAVCVDGASAGVFEELPERFSGLPVVDCADQLVIPGMSDIHVHAPQYAFRGLGMDLELLEWLNTHTFPEESHYADLDYAGRAYDIFADDLRRSPTTRAVVFGTLHVDATELLMDKLEDTGLVTYVGKVNMDRNSPDTLVETTAGSAEATRRWLAGVDGRYERTMPILTPRFTPSCTDELMAELGKIREEFGLPVQSHLSENPSECDWVAGLCPWSSCYGDAYDHFGLLGEPGGAKAVMAHCVYSGEEEVGLLAHTGTYVAHCPQSNAQLASGIAPIRRYLDLGMNVGLGTTSQAGRTSRCFAAWPTPWPSPSCAGASWTRGSRRSPRRRHCGSQPRAAARSSGRWARLPRATCSTRSCWTTQASAPRVTSASGSAWSATYIWRRRAAGLRASTSLAAR